jgi:ABC-type transport system involved in multi-copper enzyme maturation permease subunit
VFHTFFSLAFAVVTWVGPAVAAATIASERGGRTWEALLLTGLEPAKIARGKFLAALTYVALYVVMLAPVGGLAFLFGGITPAEVVIAFVLLLLIAGLSVAFGLAVSSKLSSPAVSILVTLLVAVPVSIIAYLAGGVGLSFAAREIWPGITPGAPVWLPTAYLRADFGFDYLVFLGLCPVLATIIPGWLFYEVTISSMRSPSDDRSTRLRIWTLVSAPLLTAAMIACGFCLGKVDWFIAGGGVCWLFLSFVAFLVAGEPWGPSPRVRARWARAKTKGLVRAFGPGVGRAAALAIALCFTCFAALALAGLSIATTRDDRHSLLAFFGYGAGFTLFSIGFASWARARSTGAQLPRVLLGSALFVAVLGPYIAMAIGGILADGSSRLLLIAAPSPAFAFAVVDRLKTPGGDADLFTLAASGAALGWALVGIGLALSGAIRAKERWNSEERSRATLETAPVVATNHALPT